MTIREFIDEARKQAALCDEVKPYAYTLKAKFLRLAAQHAEACLEWWPEIFDREQEKP